MKCTARLHVGFLLWHDNPPLQELLENMNPGGWQLQAVTPVGQLDVHFFYTSRIDFFGRVSMANFRGCRFHMGPALLTICCNLNTDAFVTNRPWRSMNMIVGCQTSNLSNSCQTKLPHRSFFHACQEHLPPTHPAVLETQRSQQPPLGITFARKRKNMKGKQRCCYGSWPVVVLRPADFGATSWDPVYMARIWEDSNIFESISLGVVFPKKKSCSLAHHHGDKVSHQTTIGLGMRLG